MVGLIGDGFSSGAGPATKSESTGVSVAVGEGAEFTVGEDETLVEVVTVKPAAASWELFSFFVEEANVATLVSYTVVKKLIVGEIEGDGFAFWIVSNASSSSPPGAAFGIHLLVVLLAKDSRVENLAAIKAYARHPIFGVLVAVAVVFTVADDVAHFVGQAGRAEEGASARDEGGREFLPVRRALHDVNGSLVGVVPGEIVCASGNGH